jgi:hypothetical protein
VKSVSGIKRDSAREFGCPPFKRLTCVALRTISSAATIERNAVIRKAMENMMISRGTPFLDKITLIPFAYSLLSRIAAKNRPIKEK